MLKISGPVDQSGFDSNFNRSFSNKRWVELGPMFSSIPVIWESQIWSKFMPEFSRPQPCCVRNWLIETETSNIRGFYMFYQIKVIGGLLSKINIQTSVKWSMFGQQSYHSARLDPRLMIKRSWVRIPAGCRSVSLAFYLPKNKSFNRSCKEAQREPK